MRRTKTFTVPGTRAEELFQRDNGKSFLITELPADQAEQFGLTAIMAIISSGGQVPEEALGAGMAGLAIAGLDALNKLNAATLKPLLEEMFSCIEYMPGNGLPNQRILGGENSQIEEWSTRLKLRAAWFELHTGFSLPASPLMSGLSSSAEPAKKG